MFPHEVYVGVCGHVCIMGYQNVGVRACVCVKGCVSTVGQHVSCAKTVSQNRGKAGNEGRDSLSSQRVAQCTFTELIDAAYSTKRNTAKEKWTRMHIYSATAELLM